MRLYTWIKDRLDYQRPNLILDTIFSLSDELIKKLEEEDRYKVVDIRHYPETKQFVEILKLFKRPQTPLIIISSKNDAPTYVKNSGKINFLGKVPVDVQFDHSYIKGYITKLSSDLSSLLSWSEIAKMIGYQKHSLRSREDRELFSRFLENTVDIRFFEFIRNSYSKLFTYGSSSDPITINRIINRIISYLIDIARRGDRVLLIVIDCMAWDDWFAIRDYFTNTEENSTFAMIPTLTLYSRISLLSGSLPRDLENLTFSNEERGFYNKISEELGEKSGVYIKNDVKDLKTQLQNEDIRIIGFVYSKFDEIIHSESVDKEYVYLKLQKLVKRDLIGIIKEALDLKWRVFITSDHGNIEVFENGVKLPFHIDNEGKRCGIVNDIRLIDPQIEENTFLISGQKFKHLNNANIFIFPRKRIMFSPRAIRDVEITHGGITVEEVIVPFVEIMGVKRW